MLNDDEFSGNHIIYLVDKSRQANLTTLQMSNEYKDNIRTRCNLQRVKWANHTVSASNNSWGISYIETRCIVQRIVDK